MSYWRTNVHNKSTGIMLDNIAYIMYCIKATNLQAGITKNKTLGLGLG